MRSQSVHFCFALLHRFVQNSTIASFGTFGDLTLHRFAAELAQVNPVLLQFHHLFAASLTGRQTLVDLQAVQICELIITNECKFQSALKRGESAIELPVEAS